MTRCRATGSSGTRRWSISKHDRKTIYYGGNFVFKSTDQGDNWKRISPDLTSGVDRKTLSIMGRKVEDRTMLSRNDGVAAVSHHHHAERIGARAGILWAGTDDGNVQVTRDGETWKNVVANVPGVPKGTYVSRVLAVGFRSRDGVCRVRRASRRRLQHLSVQDHRFRRDLEADHERHSEESRARCT